MSTIYQQVLKVAEKLRAQKENTFWEDYKAQRIDPVIRKLQEIEKAARPKHGFGGAFA
jgi:uncharacterized lipoprotein YddW (UPF0748 family)